MSENEQSGDGHNLEEAASKGRLPGLEEAELAEREGRDPSDTPDSEVDGTADDDAPAGGVVMGGINQH